jgi:dihydrofolate reductase
MAMSLDGFVGSADGDLKWIFNNDKEAQAWTVETVWNASLHVMGSRTFCDMATCWPTSTSVFAPPMNQIPKAVFSRQGAAILKGRDTAAALKQISVDAKDGKTVELQPGAESWTKPYVASGDLAEEIAKLKAGNGKPMIAYGGVSFARSLVASGLIDQYALLVYPIALGKGLPVFSDLAAPRPLTLISSKVFPKGAVAQIYRPA